MQKEKKKFNLIDVIIILVILAVALFFGTKFLGGRQGYVNKGEITYTVLVEGIPRETYENLKDRIPTKAVASGSYIESEIKSVTAEPCEVEKIEKTHMNNPYVTSIIVPQGDYVNLTFTITATVDLDSLLTEVGTQEVRAGRNHIVKSKYFEFTGTILTVDRAD